MKEPPTPAPPGIYKPEQTIHPGASHYFAKQEASLEGRIRLRLHVLLQDAPTTALKHTGALDSVMSAIKIELEDAEDQAQQELQSRLREKGLTYCFVAGAFVLTLFMAFTAIIIELLK